MYTMLGSYPGSTLKCTFSNILGEYDYTMLAQMHYFTSTMIVSYYFPGRRKKNTYDNFSQVYMRQRD